MNTEKINIIGSKIYIGFSVISLGYVSLLSLISPQATMRLVSTPLTNTDAISSIRGIYGGAGLVITFALIYLFKTDIKKGLMFLFMFWGSYAISRIITIFADGNLGDFGSKWLVIESILSILGLALWWFYGKMKSKIVF